MIIKDPEGKVFPSEVTDPSKYPGPPPYSPSEGGDSSHTFTPDPNPDPPPPNLTAVNYLAIRRDCSAVRGSFLVDPELIIPRELLTPLDPEQTEADRPNLKLYSHNAACLVDVWVTDPPPTLEPRAKKWAILDFGSHNAACNVKLHADLLQRPVRIHVKSHNGGATLSLPPTFTGPLIIGSRNGGVRISDAVQARLTTLSEVKGMKSCFVGDVRAAGYGNTEWQGSTVRIESHNGGAKVMFSDEPVDERSFFSRLFGW